MNLGKIPDALSVKVYPGAKELAKAAASWFAELAEDAIWKRGRFVVALSGGSTPRPTYERLASAQVSRKIDWFNVHFFWSDERAVPLDDEDSNYRMAKEALLDHAPVLKSNIHPIQGNLDPQLAADLYEHKLVALLGAGREAPRFDLILLGLGDDGHTASLFPHTAAVNERQRLVAANYVPQHAAWRITFTAPLINAARNVGFLVTGQDKAGALAQVLQGPHRPEVYPAQLVKPSPGELAWLVDEAAASKMNEE